MGPGAEGEGAGEPAHFNGDRVSVLQEEKSSGDGRRGRLYLVLNVINTLKFTLKIGEDGIFDAIYTLPQLKFYKVWRQRRLRKEGVPTGGRSRNRCLMPRVKVR